MKQKYMYECEICGCDYATERAATVCERQHYKLIQAEAKFHTGRAMPEAVDLTFVDSAGNKVNKRFYLGV